MGSNAGKTKQRRHIPKFRCPVCKDIWLDRHGVGHCLRMHRETGDKNGQFAKQILADNAREVARERSRSLDEANKDLGLWLGRNGS